MGKPSRIDHLIKTMKKGLCGQTPKTKEEEEKFKKLLQSKEKVTKLHFFSARCFRWGLKRHRLGGGPSPNHTQFNDIFWPSQSPGRSNHGTARLKFREIGPAQGVINFSGLDESTLTMNLNFYFMSGEYRGSTLCVVGRNPISSKNRELPVVDGTGVFHMARGYTISNTYSYDSAENYGVLEYTVYVAYYVDLEDQL